MLLCSEILCNLSSVSLSRSWVGHRSGSKKEVGGKVSEAEKEDWEGGDPHVYTSIIPICPGPVTLRASTVFNQSHNGFSPSHRVIFSILYEMCHCGATLKAHTPESST